MVKKGTPKPLIEVFTGGNYALDPAPMVWVDAASTRRSQPILACPHCQYLHSWLPASWLCTRCNGRMIPPPPAGGSSDPDGALCNECGRWVAGEDGGACVCDDATPQPLRAENTLTADIGLFPRLGSSCLSLENSGHTSLTTTNLGTTVSLYNPSTNSLRQIAEVCLAEVARREGQL